MLSRKRIISHSLSTETGWMKTNVPFASQGQSGGDLLNSWENRDKWTNKTRWQQQYRTKSLYLDAENNNDGTSSTLYRNKCFERDFVSETIHVWQNDRAWMMMFVCGLDDGNLSLSDPESAASSECLPEPEPDGWRLVGSLCFVTWRLTAHWAWTGIMDAFKCCVCISIDAHLCVLKFISNYI